MFSPTTSSALKDLTKSLAKLRAAASAANRRKEAADRLICDLVAKSEAEKAEVDHALRVASKLSDLLA